MRRTGSFLTLVALLAGVPTLSGCLLDPDIEDVVRSIEWELEPASLDPVVKLRLGKGSMGLAKAICGLVPDCREEGLDFLRGVDAIHLGVYEILGDRYDDGLAAFNPDLRDDFAADGWDLVVSVKGGGETVWVMAQVDDYEITGLYVVAVEDEELVVVRLEGDLTRTLDAAVRRDRDFMGSVAELRHEI